ncbi:SmvA family efflux MFS transporter [Kosakonia radicincitans]|uniref:MFS transporter, DHA2 family, multidrug resistance protein n=1 Tax=Kosakonia radicincitans TaxID=283686 RepID=A0AAX2EPB7_9ENTR|nr:SmvA family efflux MFS transporter [Kosakonia radicincitans]MDP9566957.1 DHA2 family multidrug resistance protein-like MFS transporter [Kosakonia oryzae]QEM91618.1 SmvA family efflux MFS transporter [Kosakonia radicincitans]SFE76599.1 MFS transporter, DHA2 family, multidrug resistance protein [Kosakonia radicincitans]SFR04149.1 MFS transporter, DHA2 family, multidrug resistance protein [Kosakonia radicincitans]SFT56709.1 MFS transporter, DHA2 family, multidrug resistance protein [Kosakonia 
MFRQWLTLVIIVLVYIPVAIDATVLHVAAPTLSAELNASGNELLWIIDIYSLVMAGMVLPMGALGDKIGFKRLLLIGSALFGSASLLAALVTSASELIAARALLAVGAAMIVPATLAGIRTTFSQAQHRNTALGVWAAIGSGGAAFGPLIGGILLEHFYWGSVFLLNVPIVIGVMILTARYVPRQAGRAEQPLHLNQALVLIVAILLLVWSAKTAMKGTLPLWMIVGTLISGAALLTGFVRIQLAAATPMIDMRLFTHRVILTGALMAITAMVTLVGFELLMAQELQFVHGFTPFAAGMFMLPLMLASGFSGPIAGILVSKLGLRRVATGGMALSALSFLGLSMTDFATQPWQAGSLMALLGFSAASALLASTAAIMAAAPPEKAAAAGAIESMAYELGAGLGIAVFGLILSRSFAASIQLPQGLSSTQAAQASSSIGEAFRLAQDAQPLMAQQIISAAKTAFTGSHSVALSTAGALLMLLAVGIWFSLAQVKHK